MLALAAGHSTKGLAVHSLHQQGGGSGSDQQTHPKLEDHLIATTHRQQVTEDVSWYAIYQTVDPFLHKNIEIQ